MGWRGEKGGRRGWSISTFVTERVRSSPGSGFEVEHVFFWIKPEKHGNSRKKTLPKGHSDGRLKGTGYDNLSAREKKASKRK